MLVLLLNASQLSLKKGARMPRDIINIIQTLGTHSRASTDSLLSKVVQLVQDLVAGVNVRTPDMI